jgi:hypothetical protein
MEELPLYAIEAAVELGLDLVFGDRQSGKALENSEEQLVIECRLSPAAKQFWRVSSGTSSSCRERTGGSPW